LPDLAPCDFWLFPEIKLTTKGNRFDAIPEIEAATKERLRASRVASEVRTVGRSV
jgi:hypothetical protein